MKNILFIIYNSLYFFNRIFDVINEKLCSIKGFNIYCVWYLWFLLLLLMSISNADFKLCAILYCLPLFIELLKIFLEDSLVIVGRYINVYPNKLRFLNLVSYLAIVLINACIFYYMNKLINLDPKMSIIIMRYIILVLALFGIRMTLRRGIIYGI